MSNPRKIFKERGKPEDDANNMVAILEVKAGTVFFENVTDASDKRKASVQSFTKKYELYGHQD